MTQRYYSLFEKQGRRWVQLWEMGFKLKQARRVFQTALIYQQATRSGPNYVQTTGELRLRPITRPWPKK